jgi:hypothetical protein
MLTEHAKRDRTERYDRWYRLLLAELDLVGPEAQVFAVGKVVALGLRTRGFRQYTESFITPSWRDALGPRPSAGMRPSSRRSDAQCP